MFKSQYISNDLLYSLKKVYAFICDLILASRCPPIPQMNGTEVSDTKTLVDTAIEFKCKDGYIIPKKEMESIALWTTQNIHCKVHKERKVPEWEGIEQLVHCEPKLCITPKDQFSNAKEKDYLLSKDKYEVHSVINYTCIDGKEVVAICNHKPDAYDVTFWSFPNGNCSSMKQLYFCM